MTKHPQVCGVNKIIVLVQIKSEPLRSQIVESCGGSCKSQRERADEHTFTVCSFTVWLCVLSAPIPSFAVFIIVKHNCSQDSQLTMFIICYMCSLLKSPVRSRVCGVATSESMLQTAGVRSRLLDETSSVCVRRITSLKMGWKCPFAVVSNILQIGSDLI